MDLTGIRELRSIRETEDQIYIGALTTWTDIVNAKLPEGFKKSGKDNRRCSNPERLKNLR